MHAIQEKSLRKWHLGIALVCAAAILGCSGGTKSGNTADAPVELTMLDLDGFKKITGENRGQILVVDCWSTDCEPCKKEFPKLIALSQKFKSRPVIFISLNFDYIGLKKPEELKPNVLAFLTEQKARIKNLMLTTDADTVYKKLEINSIPTVLVYDHTAKLVKVFDQEPVYAGVEPLIEKLLGEQN